MLLKYFYDTKLAQASYMVGCHECKEALVIDPARDIEQYLKAARDEGLKIAHVTETHIHADFVSGSRELAKQTRATLYLSDMGDADWKYQFAEEKTRLIADGDSWMVGNVRVDVIAMPGHTPEHVIFAITDTAGADEPIGLFTGDCLFIGSMGRPDLLEKAAGVAGTMEVGARQQYQNVQKLREMPDYLQIWPGHGAGSACGKALGALPSSTLGYEKRFNPAFHFAEENAFVGWLLEDQPEPPAYFAQMKRVNKSGPTLLQDLTSPVQLAAEELPKLLQQNALVIDTRGGSQFGKSHVPGTVNVPAGSKSFNTYAGWVIDYNQPLYLIVRLDRLEAAVCELRAIGVDKIGGYFTPESVAHLATETTPQISPQKLAEMRGAVQLIDVRNQNEFDEERIPGATHITMGYITHYLDHIARDKPVVVQCASGIRSQLAASLLQKHGFSNVMNLSGGLDAWEDAGLPIEAGKAVQLEM